MSTLQLIFLFRKFEAEGVTSYIDFYFNIEYDSIRFCRSRPACRANAVSARARNAPIRRANRARPAIGEGARTVQKLVLVVKVADRCSAD